MENIDAHEVAPRLWQGSAPPVGDALAKAGFDIVALTAEEYQPDSASFAGVEVVRVPFSDSPVLPPMQRVLAVADYLAKRYFAGDRILITCQAGRNRSGLLMGCVLLRLSGAPLSDPVAARALAERTVQLIRDRRIVPWTVALGNEFFVGLLHQLAGDPG